MRRSSMLPILLVAGCDQVFGLESRVPADAPPPPADAADAPLDANPSFGDLTPVTLTCSAGRSPGDPTLDRAETLFVYTCTTATATDSDIYVASRASATLGGPAVTILATAMIEGSPELSPDGLALYYLTFPTAGIGQIELKRRASLTAVWAGTTVPAVLNTSGDDRPGSPNGSETHIVISRGGVLVEYRLEGGTWVALSSTGTIGAGPGAVNPQLSADGLTLVFAAPRGNADLYIARRGVLGGPWGVATPITELNTAQDESDPWLSADQLRIYFARDGFLLFAHK